MNVQARFADNTNERSVAAGLRRKRFRLFMEMLSKAPPPVRILDVGGRQQYWELMGFVPDAAHAVTLLNVEEAIVTQPHFASVRGDARDMRQFADGEFDIVHSNSVIEHVGDLADQQRMANEVRRVGHLYYVQTPNRHFPIEPHFVFPFFQYLPVAVRVALVQRFDLGWYRRIADPAQAKAEVTSIRLLDRNEFANLFPNATIHIEHYAGLAKSFTAYTR